MVEDAKIEFTPLPDWKKSLFKGFFEKTMTPKEYIDTLMLSSQLGLLKTLLCASIVDQKRVVLGTEDGLYVASLAENGAVEKVADLR